jgi:transglutaminase-like putative cysteine protease
MKWPLTVLFSLICLAVSAADIERQQIIHGTDRFEFVYELTLPKLTGPAQLWLPVAHSDAFQMVKVQTNNFPAFAHIVHDSICNNDIEYLPCSARDSLRKLEIVYRVERREKSAYAQTENETAKYLQSDRLVPVNATFKTIALENADQKTDVIGRARALYDHVLHRLKYDKTGTGWGHGDAVYACDARAGNCTDFHSYFIALARSIGIPARFAIGFSIPADQQSGSIEAYHCWAEFLAQGKWVPVDISEAWKHPELADYYFGHHPANRFEVSVGRDLVVDPLPASGPINFLVYPLLQVDGKEVKVETHFKFRRLP